MTLFKIEKFNPPLSASKSHHVDDVCEHDRSEGYEKGGVINGVYQHFNNMRPRRSRFGGQQFCSFDGELSDQNRPLLNYAVGA
jgi:hypothetical protein